MCTIDKVCSLQHHAFRPLAARCPELVLFVLQMLIKGIRSFSPDNQNVVEFYKPLTLIVGHNGAGKTVRSNQDAACDTA